VDGSSQSQNARHAPVRIRKKNQVVPKRQNGRGETPSVSLQHGSRRGVTTHTHTLPHPPVGHAHAHATTPRGRSQPATTWVSTTARGGHHRTLREREIPPAHGFPHGLRRHAAAAARRRRSRERRQQEGAEAVHHHQVARELDGAGARQVPRGSAAVSRL
jgi:hypothetical protein